MKCKQVLVALVVGFSLLAVVPSAPAQSSCTGMQVLCGKTATTPGTCTNTATDPKNCGACAHACATGEKCYSGACSACPSGQIVCNGACTGGSNLCNGKCPNYGSDSKNCGSCGHACSGGMTCSQGLCNNCLAPKVLCNGTCTSLLADANNCGTCGRVCLNGLKCFQGKCQ